MKSSRTLLDEETGNRLLLSKIPGYSYGQVYNVCCTDAEIDTVAEFIVKHLAMVAGRKKKQAVVNTKLWDTPEGKQTTVQVYERHPFREQMNLGLLSNRLSSRGGKCPSLWWEKMHGSAFRARLVREGLMEGNWGNQRKGVRANGSKVNRGKVCYRRGSNGDFAERCVNYWAFSETFYTDSEPPIICRSVKKDVCPSYTGIPMTPSTGKNFDKSVVECDELLMIPFDKRMGK